MTSRVLYSAQYHKQHCTRQAFEQFGALYMHNCNDKYLARPEFEPGTSRLQAAVDTNDPSGPAVNPFKPEFTIVIFIVIFIHSKFESLVFYLSNTSMTVFALLNCRSNSLASTSLNHRLC